MSKLSTLALLSALLSAGACSSGSQCLSLGADRGGAAESGAVKDLGAPWSEGGGADLISLASPVAPIAQGPAQRPLVAVHYQTFVFEWSNWHYASHIPIVGTDDPKYADHPGYFYNSGVKGWTQSMIEKHVEWAKSYGVDAFIVEFIGNCEDHATPACENKLPVQPREVLARILRVFEAKGMPWFFFTESGPMTDDKVARAAFLSELNQHKNDQSYVRVNGKPVVMAYTTVSRRPAEVTAIRAEMEQTAGPLYFIGDFLDAAMYTADVHASCKKLTPKPPTGSYKVTARLRSRDGKAHPFTLHVVDTSTDQTIKVLPSAAVDSTSFSEVELGTFSFDGLTPIRLSDWSGAGLVVDWAKITKTDEPGVTLLSEAEEVSGGDEVSDSAASGGKAVARWEDGIYLWWNLPIGFRSQSLDEYLPAVDAISAYGIPASIVEDWAGCLKKTYAAFDGKSKPYTGWAGAGFHCDFAGWCKNLTPYGPTAATLRALLELGASRSNWIVVRSWNEFYEGTDIEPTEELGFTMLEAVRAFKLSRR